METKEIKQLLQRYFNGESSVADEQKLEAYFNSGEVADELKEYTKFFGGIAELANTKNDFTLEDDIMDYILENENREKTKFRRMWQTATGVAATIIIVLGGFLFYQQKQQPFEDTFKDPQKAYEVAEQTLGYVSQKYNKGLSALANFEKLNSAMQPLQKGLSPVNEVFDNIKDIEENN
ncbi:MAG: hypothetical protein JXR61_02545 [Prolixibacteraceae bacterium]|nr:hypothetical protein [Prolixibacteraceae bacterium]